LFWGEQRGRSANSGRRPRIFFQKQGDRFAIAAAYAYPVAEKRLEKAGLATRFRELFA
jgi:hypothetical protein